MSDVDYNGVQREAKRLFNYVPDHVQFDRPEDWREQSGAVQCGESFSGDCDEFAMTCAYLLWDRGASESDVGIAYCKTEVGTYHLVCLYRGWILDNRRDWPVAWDSVGYEWISVMYLAEPGVWLAFSEEED